MTSPTPLWSSLAAVGVVLAAMPLVALLETALPLHPRGRWHRLHLGPNLALTLTTFATNVFLNAGLVTVLVALQSHRFGVLHAFAPSPPTTVAIVVLTLDFSFYLAHVLMHRVAGLWRFHRVHHSDPAVDVTTSIRQHPGESVVRCTFLAAFAIVLGADPGAFAVYRLWSALNALLEHANVRLPLGLDGLLSLVVSTPTMHKVHHSRTPAETDTNYGNIFSIFDRLFSTFTPSRRGVDVAYGLDGLDHPAAQTTAALLALPFSGTGREPAHRWDDAPAAAGAERRPA